MQLRRGRLSLIIAAVGLTAAGAGCETRSPQWEGFQRALNEPREERSEAYRTCYATSATQEKLLKCMEAKGFGFLARAAVHREEYCQELYDSPTELPKAFCFQKLF